MSWTQESYICEQNKALCPSNELYRPYWMLYAFTARTKDKSLQMQTFIKFKERPRISSANGRHLLDNGSK